MAQLSRARDRSMHSIVATIQAEQDRAIRAPSRGRDVDLRWTGHRQDGRGAAPGGVPALHRPAPLRVRRRARRRPERRVHALHRAGAAVARRDRGGAAVAGRGRRRGPRDPPRRAGGRRREGLGPDGRADAAYVAAAGPGLAAGVPDLLARRRDPARRREARPAAPPADGPGSSQPPDPARRLVAARPDVAPGARRARSRARPRGVQRRDAVQPVVRRLRRRVVAAARRADRARLAARPRLPGARRRGRARRRSSSGCCRSRGPISPADDPVGRGRAAARRAALRARRRADPRRGGPRARRLPRWRRPGADVRGGARVRVRRPPLDAADQQHRGRPVRPRAHRRGAGPDADAVADGRPARPRGVVDDRRRPRAVVVAGAGRGGRCARAAALEGKELHEFHLSTNYRNSSEIYAYAAAYAQRVGLDADLPTAVRSTGVEPREVSGLGATSRPPPAPPSPRSPARSTAPSASSSPPPAAPTSTPGWPPGPSSPPTPPAPAPPSTPRSPPPATTGSSSSPASTPRAWSSTASSSSARRRSRPSPPPAPPPSTSSSPAPPSSSPSSPSAPSGVVPCSSVVATACRPPEPHGTTPGGQERQSRSARPVRTRYSCTVSGRVARAGARGSRRGTREAGTWREPGVAHAVDDELTAGQVAADDLEELQAVVAELLLPLDVLAVTLAVLVVLALVLADEAGLHVEEVGDPDEVARRGRTPRGCSSGIGQLGIEQPDQAASGTPAATGSSSTARRTASRAPWMPVQGPRRATYVANSCTEISRAAAAIEIALAFSRTLSMRRTSSNSARWTVVTGSPSTHDHSVQRQLLLGAG